LTAPYINAVGDIIYSKKADINAILAADAPPYAYPPPLVYPEPTCPGPYGYQEDGDGDPTTVQLTPGTVAGDFPPALGGGLVIISLAPGIYCIEGNVSLNGDITGIGVLLYVENGEIYTNGNANITLEGMTEGEFKGLLFYMPLTNPNVAYINGSSTTSMTGTIFAPATPVTINGTGGVFSLGSQVIGYTVTMSGTSTIDITYDDSKNYDGVHPPEVELSQ